MEEPREIGDWTRISVLGAGGFGMVVLWRCSKTNDSIAVKKCRLQCPSRLSDKQKERWRNEVQIMKELNHPNIVKYKILPFSLEQELNKYNPTQLPLLSMEYCRKGNLRHILTQPTSLTGLKEETIRDVLLDLSSAVSYLHDLRITHRDIKPDNIVLHDCPDKKEGTVYKLIDLGYAKELGDATVSYVGTLYYLAPEIFANRKYDCSVDYWSLGVLAFEVICGILPFSQFLNPVERFRMIQNKGPDDICIYKCISGSFQYSKELCNENQISSCLKGHMEIWLRKALQFNPKLRSTPFPNSLNIFNQLNNILKKRIVKVFIVYKYLFYFYEFDESTRLSTVQQWIARDMEVTAKELLILGRNQLGDWEDQTLLADFLAEGEKELFVFKRAALFNRDGHSVPRLVRLMFERANEQFNWRDVKAIYSHAIHYISQDIILATSFSDALDLYLKHLRMLIDKIKQDGVSTQLKLQKLVSNVGHFNAMMKGPNLSYRNNVALATRMLELFLSIDKCITDHCPLAVSIAKWVIKMVVMDNMHQRLDIIKLPQLKELLKKAVDLLRTTAESADSNNNIRVVEMMKITGNALKLKDKLLSDKNLDAFITYLGKAVNHLECLTTWTKQYDSHIENLSKVFDMIAADAFLAFKKKPQGDAIPFHSSTILNDRRVENEVRNCSISASRFTELDDLMRIHKQFCDDIISFLPDTFS